VLTPAAGRPAVNKDRGLWLRKAGDPPEDGWLGGIGAVTLDDPNLRRLAAGADLFATSVGPSSLQSVGRLPAPLLRTRLEASNASTNAPRAWSPKATSRSRSEAAICSTSSSGR